MQFPGVPGTDHDIDPAPCISRFVEAGGRKLHYLDYGTAGCPAMLCLHGGGAHGHWFDFIAGAFTADHHVRALDQRGHGDSEWAGPLEYDYECYVSDLVETVEKLDLRDFVLIGHSMGGNIALLYAAQHPGRVGRLVVIDSTMSMSGERAAAMREFGSRTGRRYATREEFVTHFRLRPSGTAAGPARIRHIAHNACRQAEDGSWVHKFDRNVYGTRKPVNTLPCWERIAIPALLVKGDRSRRIGPEIHSAVKSRAPQVALAEVANSDHHVTLDDPAGFVRAVKAFLARSRDA